MAVEIETLVRGEIVDAYSAVAKIEPSLVVSEFHNNVDESVLRLSHPTTGIVDFTLDQDR